MISEVCVDANVAVKWFAPEALRDEAVAFADECSSVGVTMIAPEFIFTEASSAIRRQAHRGLLLPVEGLVAVSLLMRAPITPFDSRFLYQEAWRIAEMYRLPTLYDAYYLALAELRKCDFWTADERFINSVAGLPYVKHISDFAPGCLGA